MDREKIIGTENIKEYFLNLENQINVRVDLARKARKTGVDIADDIETFPAAGIAEKTEVLTGPKGVAKKYNELWDVHKNREKVMLEIFNMILDRKLGDIEDPEKRLDQAIRTAIVILTEAVVVSPLDGIPDIKISTNLDGSKYVDIYFAGPIRAAGGTGQTWPLILADLARKKLHLDVYKPSKKEKDRIVEELSIYQTDVVVRQMRMSEEEMRIIAENTPICVNCWPDSAVEVIKNRDLERIKSNRLREAMCLVLIDGIFVRKEKILKIARKLDLNWNWLEKMIKVKKTLENVFEIKPNYKYLEGIAAGRPVYAYPSRPGGFRLRYGKSRNNGLMGKSIHPATMHVLDSFPAVGAHAKIERPGKACQVFPCETIDGPIVLLKDNSVVKIESEKQAIKILSEIKEILFVGDILITVGDFKKSGNVLLKSGFVEEEWLSEIKYLYKNNKLEKKEYESCLKFYNNPDPYSALDICLKYNLPLFPKYICYYDLLTKEELKTLIEGFRNCSKIFEDKKLVSAKVTYTKNLKDVLEKIGLPHKLTIENEILIDCKCIYPFLKTIGALNAKNPLEEFDFEEGLLICEILTKISKIEIRDKSGTWIGMRMGKPEAAHERSMAGKPNVLFPLGQGFGNNRDMVRACTKKSDGSKEGHYGINDVKIKSFLCPSCKKVLFQRYCSECKQTTKEIRYCETCKKQTHEEVCEKCGEKTKLKLDYKIDLDQQLSKAIKNLKVSLPDSLKTVKDLISEHKAAEPLEKGILRARNDVYVFRDGTCRYEAVNAIVTQISAKELGITLEKLKSLGYKKDIYNKDLKEETQLVNLFPQDVIVDDGCGEYMLRVCKFLDELLEKFYGLKPFYNAVKKEDLIGELVVCLAPHTSAGIVGRIIGYSKTKLCWTHPYFVTAKRRNIDGDQDSLLMLLDVLLNFSYNYISAGRGGRMDVVLSFTTILNPLEVDDESHDMEVANEYPYEFYQAAKKNEDPKIKELTFVEDVLSTEQQYDCISFTHNTSCFDQGPKRSTYITIKNMTDKVLKVAELQKRIRCVDEKNALERLITSHFFPDIIGNTRAFTRQKLRCIKCNAKYRRIPLSGKCTCGGKLILTIAEGSIKKYIEITRKIIKDYGLQEYLSQRVDLAEEEIDVLFYNKEEKDQKKLLDFF